MKAHVMVVDDDELVRSGMAGSLEELGWRVSTAATGEEAMALMASDPADIVLTDLVLGPEDGIALLRRLREAYPSTPVLVITGHGTAANAIESLRQGAADYLQKPVRAEDIDRRLDTVLAAHRLRARIESERETARQEAESRELRTLRADRFESALRFAKGLAEELSPLLECAVTEGLPPERRAAVERAAQRIRDLVALTADAPADPKPFNLNDVVAAALDAPSVHEARDRRPDLLFEAHLHEEPVPVRGQPAVLRAVLVVLFPSMIRACPPGGRLTLATGREEHKEPWGHFIRGPSGAYGVLRLFTSVRAGAEEIDRMFEPYAARQILSGHGLAMPLLLRCIRVHRGLTLVRTSPSPAGTDLRLLFPLDAVTAGGSPRPSSGDGLRILVVDDTPAHRADAVALFKELGCHVDEAADSASAIRRMDEAADRGQPYNVALVDLVLGEPTDGVDLARQIVSSHPGIAVLLCGGFADLGRIAEGRSVGVLDYLQKPIEKDVLARALEQLRHRPAPPASEAIGG